MSNSLFIHHPTIRLYMYAVWILKSVRSQATVTSERSRGLQSSSHLGEGRKTFSRVDLHWPPTHAVSVVVTVSPSCCRFRYTILMGTRCEPTVLSAVPRQTLLLKCASILHGRQFGHVSGFKSRNGFQLGRIHGRPKKKVSAIKNQVMKTYGGV